MKINPKDNHEIYTGFKILTREYKVLSVRKLKAEYQNLKQSVRDMQLRLSLQEEAASAKEQELVRLKQSMTNDKEEYSKRLAEQKSEMNSLNDLYGNLKIENLNLKELVKQKSDYRYDQWCTGWIEYWKAYFIENYRNVQAKISLLKSGVDEISQGTIDLILERNFELFPIQKYTPFFLYNYEKIYQEWEKAGMREGLAENEIRTKYHIAEEVYLETPVFKFHCGLKCIPSEITELIKEKDIIDGGAFWGDSAVIFEEYQPGSIHAFEPMTINYHQLCETKEKNQLDNLYPVNLGLGEKKEEKTLYFHEMLSGASVINYKALYYEKPEENADQISITSIDEYVEKEGLDVGVIKLDIEGSELEAIKGARNTICKFRPILLISVYHLPKDFFEIKPLLESLGLGYKFMFRKLVFHDPLTEVSLIGYIPQNRLDGHP